MTRAVPAPARRLAARAGAAGPLRAVLRVCRAPPALASTAPRAAPPLRARAALRMRAVMRGGRRDLPHSRCLVRKRRPVGQPIALTKCRAVSFAIPPSIDEPIPSTNRISVYLTVERPI